MHLEPEARAAPLPAAGERAFVARLALWLAPFAILGAFLVHLYPDSYQQDGGFHYLFARWAVEHPRFLVDVWGRPLFTALYALPSRLGYPAAKLLTVIIALAAAWHTARLAREHGLERAEVAVPLLFLQPSFLQLCSETMTEPLFALVLAVALRLHRAGRVGAGLRTAALLPLARPEGLFVALLWGVFAILDRRGDRRLLRRALSTAQLALGVGLWWLSALLLSGDPLYLLNHWPRNWAAGAGSSAGPLWQYWLVRDQILAGPMLLLLFAAGLATLALRRRLCLAMASMVLVAGLHSLFFRFGFFGAAGYARYLVCVAPPIALATLAGWNLAARCLRSLPRPVAQAAGAAVLGWAALSCAREVDGQGASRDARAVADTYAWFAAHPRPRPVRRLVFSQAYMSILFDRDWTERPDLGLDPDRNVELLRASPPGTLVFWDARTGPQYHRIGRAELERAGYEQLRAASYALEPLLPRALLAPSPRAQEMLLYYKPFETPPGPR